MEAMNKEIQVVTRPTVWPINERINHYLLAAGETRIFIGHELCMEPFEWGCPHAIGHWQRNDHHHWGDSTFILDIQGRPLRYHARGQPLLLLLGKVQEEDLVIYISHSRGPLQNNHTRNCNKLPESSQGVPR
jgi:hypothetical protein